MSQLINLVNLRDEYIFVVFFGHINSGKSSLIRELCGKQTKITLNGNYNLEEIDYYWRETNPFLIYVDTAGFLLGRKSGSSKNDMEFYVEDLTKSVKKNFLLLRTDISEAQQFKFVYVLLESNGNLSKHYILAISYLEKSKKKWFLLNSKIDTRLCTCQNEYEKAQMLENRKREIFMQLRCINREVLKNRLYFISTNPGYKNSNWNQLSVFALKFENNSYLFLDYRNEFCHNYGNLDIDINIGVFGGGNIGKSTLIKLITSNKRIKVQNGVCTRNVECFDHPEYSIVHFYDTPGDDGMDVCVDIENATHAFDIIFLLINDSLTESDINLVEDIKLHNSNNTKQIKLFVIKTFFEIDFINKNDIKQAKLMHMATHLGQLDLPAATPFYCVTLLEEYRNLEFNDDLNRFLVDWFELGLSDSQKLDCIESCPKSVIDENKLADIKNRMNGHIKSIMTGSFFWNIIPICGTLLDKIFVKKFIKRYAILLKLNSNGQQAIKEHYTNLKNYKRDSLLEDIIYIENKYLDIDAAASLVYDEALKNFGEKFPAFKNITKLYRFDSPVSMSLTTFAEIGIKTVSGLLASLIDDISNFFPMIMPKFSIVGALGIGLSLVFCFTAVFHIYLLTREIPDILINDAKVIYLSKS